MCYCKSVKKRNFTNMPKYFAKFKDTKSVLDCTEVKIQTLKCFKCKVEFYSHYKGHLIVKFMTEVTLTSLSLVNL